MTTPQIVVLISSIAVFLLAVLFLLIPYITYSMAFLREKKDTDPFSGLEKPSAEAYRDKCRALITELISTPCEEISMTSYDGLTLYAKYYRGKDGAPLEIQCHGYKSTPMKDFSGGGLEAIKRGRHLLLIIHRAHGKSEGRTISFGYNEKRDLIDWTNLMLERLGRDTKVIYTGISMGAGTVLQAAGMESLPENVRAIVADCPFSSTEAITKCVIKEMGIPPKIAYPFLRLGAIIYGGFDPNKASPVDAVKTARVPILLIHGEEDRFVPTEMSEEIRLASTSNTRRITFPVARHGTSYLIDSERYMREVDAFLKESGIE